MMWTRPICERPTSSVIDYVLADWPEPDATATISLRPPDGLALAAVLRGHAEKLAGSPTAFVLRSAHLPELSSGFPPETRLHVYRPAA